MDKTLLKAARELARTITSHQDWPILKLVTSELIRKGIKVNPMTTGTDLGIVLGSGKTLDLIEELVTAQEKIEKPARPQGAPDVDLEEN